MSEQPKKAVKVVMKMKPNVLLTAEEIKERELILLIHSPYRECDKSKNGLELIGMKPYQSLTVGACFYCCKSLIEKLKKHPEQYSYEIKCWEEHKNNHESSIEKYKATKLLGLRYKFPIEYERK